MRRNNRFHMEMLESRQHLTAVPAPVPAGSVKLTGTVIGTNGSYRNGGNVAANAFDENPTTFFDAPAGAGWAGLDLGLPQQVTQVQFVPRGGYASRMVGGVFQSSTTPDFSANVTTLFTVKATPVGSSFTAAPVTAGVWAQYVRYVGPANGCGNVAELEFDGVASAPAFAPSAPAVTATASAAGVQLGWVEDPGGIATSFAVLRQGPSDPTYVQIGIIAGGGTGYADSTAASNAVYSYEVVAANAAGSSPASTAVLVTTPPPFVNPWSDSDIGSPSKAGSAVVTPGGPVTITGGGSDIWNQTDQFNFESQPLVGNGMVTARVTSQTNTNGWAKSGIMIRETSDPGSREVLLALTPGNGVTMQVRSATHTTPGFSTSVPGKAGVWLQLRRIGSSISGYCSTDGMSWTLVGTSTVPMVNNVLAGLCVSSHNTGKTCAATFANASVTAAAVRASAWSDAATAPMPRWESETFSYNGLLYVFGGFVDRTLDATAECDVYDPVANSWSQLTTVPTGPLTHAGVAVVGDTAYFAGGDVGTFQRTKVSTATSAVLTFDLTTGAWGTAPSLPVAQSCGGLVYVNNHLYEFGGLDSTDSTDLSTTWSLDLGDPTAGWVAGAAMPNGRNHLGGASINGLIYAVGGNHLYNETKGNDAEVDAYDPVADVWTKVASLPVPLGSNQTTTTAVDGKIVVVGGQTNGGYDGVYQNAVLAYDPVANSWSQVATLPEAEEGGSATYVDGQLVVADGTVDNQGGWAQSQVWITAVAI